MTTEQFHSRSTRAGPGIAALACLCLVPAAALPQMTDAMGQPIAQPGMPMSPGMPQQGAPSSGSNLKQVFAGTLATVLQTTGVGVAGAIAQGLTGALASWFSKPAQQANAAAPSPMMGQPMGGMTADPMGGMTAQPMGGMQTQSMGGMPSQPMGGMPGPGMGMPDSAAMPGSMPMAAPSSPPMLYAGMAFEVHWLHRDGRTQAVDPATHYFATGDRFVVFYRPTLPGRVNIFNVNPLGEEKQIDAVNVAAGELARLGPYEFRGTTGQELLRLILSPCSSPQLYATTRDIVRVDDYSQPMPMPTQAQPPAPSPALGLGDCNAVTSRSARPTTRDIAKVEMDGDTLFALDPVSPQEVASGRLEAREITIALRHR
jgi:hypothetical protein